MWRLSSAHGSKGTLGDIGIHILEVATLVANADVTSIYGRLQVFPKAPDDRIGEYVLDVNDSFVMTAELDGGALATIHATRMAPGHSNAIKLGVFGTEGGLEIDFEEDVARLRLCNGSDVNTQNWQDVELAKETTLYDRFVAPKGERD